jgi:small-conductance mechanosensitive channel
MATMDNPWLEWWDEVTFEWMRLNLGVVQRQLAVMGVVLLLALVLERILARQRDRWLGSEADRHRMWNILWAARYPVLVLVWGYAALALYDALGRPTYTLHRLVTLFWFIAAYAVLAAAIAVLVPAGDARRFSRRVLMPALALVGILHLTGLLSTTWAWATQQQLGLPATSVTLAGVWLALLIVAGFWLVSIAGKRIFMRAVLPRTETDANLARSVANFVQFAVVVAGLWLAIDSLGVDFSNLTLLITALTVGIGFGLQDLIKNVMGGVILLAEGHVRPNEVFRIGGKTGVVERIGIRSTTLRTWDGSQVIVPNADLIADRVTDLSDMRRIDITIGVSGEADLRLTERLLLELAADHPEVVDEPAPSVYFTNLGASTFDFTLYCYVDDRSKVIRTKSDLYYALIETFRRHELEIPSPQYDLNLRSGPWKEALGPPAP